MGAYRPKMVFSALADKPLTNRMQRLKVKLIGGLRRHKLHRRMLHRLGDRFGISKSSF